MYVLRISTRKAVKKYKCLASGGLGGGGGGGSHNVVDLFGISYLELFLMMSILISNKSIYRISLISPRPCLVCALKMTVRVAPASELYCAPSNRPHNTT